MPNLKSAKKRLRQNEATRLHNRMIKKNVRTRVKSVLTAIEEGDVETAETVYRDAARKLDRAGAKNIIHRNAAARTKSRLQARIKALKQG